MLARMSSQELEDWMDYYQVEPFGHERDDWGRALQTAHLLGPHLKQDAKIRIEELMPDYDGSRAERPPDSDSQMMKALKAVTT